MKKKWQPGCPCCMTCDGIDACHDSYTTAEIILDGIADNSCTTCENANDTYLTNQHDQSIDECCTSWYLDSSGGICGVLQWRVALRIQKVAVSNPWEIEAGFYHVRDAGGGVFVSDCLRYKLSGAAAENAIIQLCQGEQVSLPFVGGFTYAGTPPNGGSCEAGDGTPGGNLCAGSSSTCLVTLS